MPASAFEGKLVEAFTQRPSTLHRARYLSDARFLIAPDERLTDCLPCSPSCPDVTPARHTTQPDVPR